MHKLRTIVKQTMDKSKKNPMKKKKTNDHRVSLKEGSQITQTMGTPGFQLILEFIKNELESISLKWMDEEDKDKREESRLEAKAWKKVLKQFDALVQKKEVARKVLRYNEINNLEPQD